MMLLRYHPVSVALALWKTFMYRRWMTHDREATPILVSEKIGIRRYRTPEGFLFIEGVPIARVGDMMYGAEELPVLKAGPNGMLHVTRDAEALFAPRTLASFQGKPIIDDHPEEPDGSAGSVTPKNWAQYKQRIHGVALNPRRGTGDDADVILADFLVTTNDGIRLIDSGKVEVSAGYESDYQQTGVGRGRQLNIIGNHIALVQRGRCGPRCAIGDSLPHSTNRTTKENGMPGEANPNGSSPARRRAAVIDRARETLAELDTIDADDEVEGNHVHVHLNGNGVATADAERLAVVEKSVGEPSAALTTQTALLQTLVDQLKAGGPTRTNDGAGDDPEPAADAGLPEEITAARIKTGDSAALETSFKAVLSDAEVLAPGYRLPAFDGKAKRAATMDSMCKLRRGVLQHVAATNDGAQMLNALGGGSLDPNAGTCVEVATLFRTAAATKKLLNNRSTTTNDGKLAAPLQQARKGPPSTAQVQAQIDEFWKNH